MRLIRFGTTDLPDNGTDSLPIEYRSNLVDLQNGSFDLDGNTSVLSSVTVTRDTIISVSVQNIQNTIRAITTQANRGRAILRGEEIDNTQYLTFAKVSRINYLPNSEKYGFEQPIAIAFAQDYPFWLNSADVENFLDDGEIFDDYAWNFDGGNNDILSISGSSASTTVDTLTINNTGSAPCYRGYFILNFQGAYDVNWIKIINHTNGMMLTYNLDISGVGGIGSWTFDWLSKSLLTNTSDLDRTGLVIPNNQMDWFRLEVGNNNLEFQVNHAGDTDATLYVFWSRHYTY